MTENVEFVLGKVENNLGKRENAGYQHFLLFPNCFQTPSTMFFKSGLCGKGLKPSIVKSVF